MGINVNFFGIKKIKLSVKSKDLQYKTLSSTIMFDRLYYVNQAKKAGKYVDPIDSVSHYINEGDSLRISPHPLFDAHYYHHVHGDIEGSGMTSLFHFILHGYKEFRQVHPLFDMRYVSQQIGNRDCNPLEEYLMASPGTYNPHPDIDEHYIIEQLEEAGVSVRNALSAFLAVDNTIINPSRDFDMHAYIQLNPDIRPYNAAYHYAIAGKKENRRVYKAASSLSGLDNQINKAAELDIDIIPPHTNLISLDRSFSIDNARDAASLLRLLRSSTDGKSADKILLLPHFEHGGAEKVVVNVVKAMLEHRKDQRVLLLLTDSASESALSWLPRNNNLFVCNISSYVSHMDEDETLRIIGVYLQTCYCKDLYVINSRIGWNLVERYGRSISNNTQCHAFVFCYDYDEFGRRAGYAWTHLAHCVEFLNKIFTDNSVTGRQISNDLRFDQGDENKFTALYQPVDLVVRSFAISATISKSDRRYKKKNILWAGRFHRQKNIKLAIDIAALMPEYDFIFAGGFADDMHLNGIKTPENVNFVGPYNNFNSLSLENISLFLYTSSWDGLPNILLEVGSCGIPIIARDIGGISDLVNMDTGWIVDANEDALSFSKRIRDVFSDESEKDRRVGNMHDLIRTRHSWNAFLETASKYL